MTGEVPDYGLGGLVVLNSAIFIFFAFSFFKPQTRQDWRKLRCANAKGYSANAAHTASALNILLQSRKRRVWADS